VAVAARAVTLADILDGHTVLDIECLDRIYLNGYVPGLMSGGQVAAFLHHRGFPIASPAALGKNGNAFRHAMSGAGQERQRVPPRDEAVRGGEWHPVDRLRQGRPQARRGPPVPGRGGAVRDIAGGGDRSGAGVPAGVGRHRAGRARRAPVVLLVPVRAAGDLLLRLHLRRRAGPGFIKICSYAPYPVKIWLNGHEAVRRMAGAAGLDVQMLGNRFAACDDPAGLQAVCDQLGEA
jgi:hypothetical protein